MKENPETVITFILESDVNQTARLLNGRGDDVGWIQEVSWTVKKSSEAEAQVG